MVMDKTTMSVQELSAQMGISLPKEYAISISEMRFIVMTKISLQQKKI